MIPIDDLSDSQLRQRIAWHEAAHTLIATLNDWVVIKVTIRGPDLPHTLLDTARIDTILSAPDQLSPGDQEVCIQEYEIALAGYAAEKMEFGTGLPGPLAYKAYRFDAHRIRNVRRALRERAGRNVRNDDLMPQVISVLRKHRDDALFNLVTEIVGQGELSGDAVRDILRGVTP